VLTHFDHFNFIIEDGFTDEVSDKVFNILLDFSIRFFINPLAEEAGESSGEHIETLDNEFK
jgi:hypothetical protein